MKKVAVSIHATENFTPKIIQGLKNLDYIHVDVMDGKFVNNKNNNLGVFRILKENCDIPIIAHLMVINPFDYFDKIIDFIEVFLFHFEVNEDKRAIINDVKSKNKKVGLAINPETELSEIISFLKEINIILVMAVHPGHSGQKFIPETVEKVNQLAKYKKKYNFEIDVDGGINLENAKRLKNADILSSASTILKAENPNLIINALKYSDKDE